MIRPFFYWMNVALQGSMLPFVEAVKSTSTQQRSFRLNCCNVTNILIAGLLLKIKL